MLYRVFSVQIKRKHSSVLLNTDSDSCVIWRRNTVGDQKDHEFFTVQGSLPVFETVDFVRQVVEV